MSNSEHPGRGWLASQLALPFPVVRLLCFLPSPGFFADTGPPGCLLSRWAFISASLAVRQRQRRDPSQHAAKTLPDGAPLVREEEFGWPTFAGLLLEKVGLAFLFAPGFNPPDRSSPIRLPLRHGKKNCSTANPWDARASIQIVRNKKCHVTSTPACTSADAKIDPVFLHVHP